MTTHMHTFFYCSVGITKTEITGEPDLYDVTVGERTDLQMWLLRLAEHFAGPFTLRWDGAEYTFETAREIEMFVKGLVAADHWTDGEPHRS